jgi:hypothetical protein
MDRKSKIFFVVFFLLIVGAIGVTYYRYFIVRDYMIEAQASCDPFTEACFVYVCDPEAEECTGDPDQDTSYYKNISRNAKNIPLCNPLDEDCDALTCPPGEANCTLTLCDPDTVPEGVVCNDPSAYTALHPEEDDAEGAMEQSDATESEDVAPGIDEGTMDGASE